MSDPFNLERFIEAQDAGGTYQTALSELRYGRKEGHWIWYLFPQLKGLGRSATSEFYGISGAEETKAYMEHKVLGPRLIESFGAFFNQTDKTAQQIFGHDAVKVRSCVTLFDTVTRERATSSNSCSSASLRKKDQTSRP
jgi:uncharacterized protein (DUF1810 family)